MFISASSPSSSCQGSARHRTPASFILRDDDWSEFVPYLDAVALLDRQHRSSLLLLFLVAIERQRPYRDAVIARLVHYTTIKLLSATEQTTSRTLPQHPIQPRDQLIQSTHQQRSALPATLLIDSTTTPLPNEHNGTSPLPYGSVTVPSTAVATSHQARCAPAAH